MSIRTLFVFVAVLVLVGAGFAFYTASQEPGPLMAIHGPKAVGGGGFELDLGAESRGGQLPTLSVRLEQDGKQYPLPGIGTGPAAQLVQESTARVRLKQVVPAALVAGLHDGTATLIVEASHGVLFGFLQASTTVRADVGVRLAPPSLEVVSTHHHIRMGGSELVLYRVLPANCESGVEVGDRFYRGYPAAGVAGGKVTDPSLHAAFFALAFDQDANVPIRLTARDAAGNSTMADFSHVAIPSTFSQSDVPITDQFLQRVVPPVVENTPGLDLAMDTPEQRLESFLDINRELRRQNNEHITAVSSSTSPEWLAQGVFKRLAGSKTEAPFAQHRTYFLAGREIDQQVHLGFDLASTRGAVVTSSNAGRVVFAAYLGIYGNCIILDHGMGVQTLYAHLSSMDVEKGDRVEKGETIGHSGATGMAAGDHVHFTVLVGGTPVTPVEWWDAHWIRDRIERKLTEAGIR